MAKKRGRKSKRLYFTEDTEQAIVEYLASDDQDERNKIYNRRIHIKFYNTIFSKLFLYNLIFSKYPLADF